MLRIQIAIVISFLAAGCYKTNSNSSQVPPLNNDSSNSQVLPPESDSSSSQVYFPNRVGDEWHYLVDDTTIRANGIDSPTVSSSQYYVDIEIVGRTRLENRAIATIWQYQYPGSIDTNYVYQSGDSILFLDRHKFSTPKVYITPYAVGSNWLCLSGELDFKKVVSQGTITIGDSTYTNAWEIVGGTTLADADYYLNERFKEHVGFVKTYFNNSYAFLFAFHHTAWFLISYNLK